MLVVVEDITISKTLNIRLKNTVTVPVRASWKFSDSSSQKSVNHLCFSFSVDIYDCVVDVACQ